MPGGIKVRPLPLGAQRYCERQASGDVEAAARSGNQDPACVLQPAEEGRLAEDTYRSSMP
jgi:hypothetical protein